MKYPHRANANSFLRPKVSKWKEYPQTAQEENRTSIPIGGEGSNLIADPVQNDHSQQAAKSEPSNKVEVPLRPESEDPKHDVTLGTPKAKDPRSSKLLFLL